MQKHKKSNQFNCS